jgi:hypothetical protein
VPVIVCGQAVERVPLKIAVFPIGRAGVENAGKTVGRRSMMAMSESTVIRDAQPDVDDDAVVLLMPTT